MPEAAPTAPPAERPPFFSYNPVFIGLRYLLHKKLSYLAVFGVALSVATIIVVMSVFTGFQLQLTSVIRGYLSDVTIRPALAGEFGYGLENWRDWRQQVLGTAHVEGVAPFLDSIALLRLPGQRNVMGYLKLRGVDPDLEGTVSKLPEYMQLGALQDLNKTYPTPEGGKLRTCFVGQAFLDVGFPGLDAASVRQGSVDLILITATTELDRQVAKFAVNGLFTTGNYKYDTEFVIMSLDTASDFVKSGGAVTGLNVRLDDYRNANAVRDELKRKFQAGRTLRTYGEASAPVQNVALSGDGARLAGATRDGQVIVWDVTTGKELRRVPATGAQATVAALSDDGALLLVGRADGSAALLKTDSGEEVRSVAAAGSPVTAARLAPDDRYFALGRKDGSAGVWEAEGAAEPVMLKGHTAAVNDMAFSSDAEQAATASADGTARVWDVASGALKLTLPGVRKALVTAVAFDPNGERLLVGQADGVIALWDTAKGGVVTGWPAGGGAVHAILFGPGSNAFMTATGDAVTGWAMETVGNRLGARITLSAAEPSRDLRSAAFAGNGQSFVSVAADGQPLLRYSGPQFSIKTWEEHDATFVEAVAMERFLQALILSLILVLAEFSIFALVSTIVTEKRRDIGILKAVGFTSRQVSTVFLVVGLSIGVLGGLLGVGAGLLFAHNINAVREFLRVVIGFDPFPPQLYYFTEVPSHVTADSVITVAGGAVLCALLFSIVPAIHAARMDPVRTLQYE